ncbi:hypothetical protein HED51_12715 [Ochrobactrum grignonense]|nr:hypothetical protein [Brucella grignonensis]
MAGDDAAPPFPVRRILQNPLTAECVGDDLVRISGPTPIAVVERLHAAAGAVGAKIETWNGLSKWALPRHAVRCPNERIREDFLGRMALTEKPASRRAQADIADTTGVHAYQVIGKFDEERGLFVVRYDEKVADGLYRLERKESPLPVPLGGRRKTCAELRIALGGDPLALPARQRPAVSPLRRHDAAAPPACSPAFKLGAMGVRQSALQRRSRVVRGIVAIPVRRRCLNPCRHIPAPPGEGACSQNNHGMDWQVHRIGLQPGTGDP